MYRRVLFACLTVVAALAVACGGGGPSSPSGANGVAVEGIVLGEGASFASSSGSHPAAAKAQKITVSVEGTTITAEVAANGSFRLTGIPSGTFTLVFLVDGVSIGSVVVTAGEGSEVKIVVQVKDSALHVVQIKVEGPDGDESGTCTIAGGKVGQGIELEGEVSSGDSAKFEMKVGGERSSGLVTVTTSSSTSFTCVGGARTTGECKDAVKTGAKVHVRGTLTTCSNSAATVSATEVKVQKN